MLADCIANVLDLLSTSKKKAADETEYEKNDRLRSRCIWLEGQKGVTEWEAAVMVVDEARQLLQRDLGEMGISWQPPKDEQKGNMLHGPSWSACGINAV